MRSVSTGTVCSGAVKMPLRRRSKSARVRPTCSACWLQRPGELLSRDEIIAAAWPRTAVGDNNLNVQISTSRRALDQEDAQGSCIQTIPGRGYRFVAPVKRVEADPHSAIQTISHGEPSPPRLSIAVLPFVNVGNDPEQHSNLVNGITEDLTTDLSRLESMLVISRNPALTYRDRPVDPSRIGRELSVRYVLQGSVQRSGKQVRVSAQLIDAESDAHLWAERFDGDTGDLFALQNEITGRIANALGVELIAAEAARPTETADAPDYILRGRAARLKRISRDTHAERISMFEHALAIDPRSVEAQSLLAGALVNRVLDAVSDSEAADIARAEELYRLSLGGSASQPDCAYGQRRRATRAGPIRGSHSRIRDSAREQSQRRTCVARSCGLQVVDRVDRGSHPARGAGHPAQSLRSPNRLVVPQDWARASATIAHRRGDPMARKGAPRHSEIAVRAPPSRLGLCPQRRDRTRRRRTRRSPAIARRRSLSKHRPRKGLSRRILGGGAEDPRLVRRHLSRRVAEGWNARRMNAIRRKWRFRSLCHKPRRGR
jgi:TolB-like protein